MERAREIIKGRKELDGKGDKEKLQMAHEIATGANSLMVSMGYTYEQSLKMATDSVVAAHTTANNAAGGAASTPPAADDFVLMSDGKETRQVARAQVETARSRGFKEVAKGKN
jgi:hypothetical protein